MLSRSPQKNYSYFINNIRERVNMFWTLIWNTHGL